jgi:hypothetical protein
MANGNGYCEVRIHYNDLTIARTEFGRLVQLARENHATDLPEGTNSGTMVFGFRNIGHRRDFYGTLLDLCESHEGSDRFHFHSGEFVPSFLDRESMAA